MKKLWEQMIRDYVDGYNNFDIEKMTANLDKHVRFKNISGGETNMSLDGLESFRAQAEEAKKLFSLRKQTIKQFAHKDDRTEVEIDYHAVLAMDQPNGLKKGDELNLEGKSIFQFSGDKIISITDVS